MFHETVNERSNMEFRAATSQLIVGLLGITSNVLKLRGTYYSRESIN